MKPSNVQTSPGGKSNTKKNNILNNNNNNPESNQKNFPQIRKPTLTLAEVEKQINAEKQAKNKVRNSASTVVTNQTNNSNNFKNSSILIQNPQASSIKSSKQNLTTATLATATSATTSNPRLLQSNTPSSNIVTKKSQSRPNKRKQTFSTKSQNDSKQQTMGPFVD